jgi:23S rRNA (adenine2503-C2)-methyltransferase
MITTTPLPVAPSSLVALTPQDSLAPVLTGLTLDQLKQVVLGLDEPSFRAEQLHHWLYVKCAQDWSQMTNLARSFKDKLSAAYRIGCLHLADKTHSTDGTIKYLFKLDDGQVVESVLMHFEDRDTYAICLSTQVGCAVNCDFCATGKLGFKRNLSVAEIVEQYLFVQANSGEEIRNIVFMGQGEPLLNYDNLIQAIRILNQSAEVGIRHITVSTSGIVPKIEALAAENLQLTLAISLHAPDNATRELFMPINRKWPLEALMPALHRYVGQTGRRLTIEYILLAGINDSFTHARRLTALLQGLKCNVNLIPYNPIGDDYGYLRPSRAAIFAFRDAVAVGGKKVTIRMERGTDIGAACGQLANQYQASLPTAA